MQTVKNQIEQLFRRESGKLVAYLARVFGPGSLNLAENAVQEALIKALQTWPVEGIPDNPSAWLLRVAKNQALDGVRRDRNFQHKEEEIIYLIENQSSQGSGDNFHFEDEIEDDQLRLIFTCCHPVLVKDAQVALTLKTLCGFSVGEIARAFLGKEETIAQRIVRAKQKIKDENVPYEIPEPKDLKDRLDSVLDIFYFMFNEGYSAHQGEDLIRYDICDEAIRLCEILARHRAGDFPKVHALLALMYLQASRFKARLDADGDITLLENQDRSLWDKQKIAAGVAQMEKAMGGSEVTEFHLQAGIAACHSLAPSYGETNWARVVDFYDQLINLNPSPIFGLNRAVAMAEFKGPEAGIRELKKIEKNPVLQSYYLLPAVFAELYRRQGKLNEARTYYAQALELVGNEPERRFLEKRLTETSA